MTPHDALRARLERSNLIAARLTPDGRKIATSHDFPPIPTRSFDWSAYLADEYDGAPDAGFQPVGHGPTEIDAISDLLDLLEERET